MNRDMIGYTIEQTLEPIYHADAIAYAKAIQDNNPVYTGNSGLVCPFYTSKLILPVAKPLYTHNALNLNLLRMVHGEQEVIWHRPLRVGDRPTAKLTLTGIEDTSAGELLKFSIALICHEIVCSEVNTGFLVRGPKNGKKDKESPKVPDKSRVSKPSETKDKSEAPLKEMFRLTLQTIEGQQYEYAKASGDTNFIHTSNFLAKLAGFPRTILHGLCVMAMTCSALTEAVVSNDITRLVRLKGRFSNIVIPGQALELIGYKGNQPPEIFYEVISPSGKPVIKNGLFEFKS